MWEQPLTCARLNCRRLAPAALRPIWSGAAQPPPARLLRPVRDSSGVLARSVRRVSRRRWSALQELSHRPRDGLGTLDVQDMANTIDRAVLDVPT
jgi:hypothetical protein